MGSWVVPPKGYYYMNKVLLVFYTARAQPRGTGERLFRLRHYLYFCIILGAVTWLCMLHLMARWEKMEEAMEEELYMPK